MRYFHRTSSTPEQVLEEADRYFVSHGAAEASGARHRVFAGTIGKITVKVFAEGGHYTLVNVETDQVGESEADRVAKRFLTQVHQTAEPDHVARGAY